MNNKTIQAILYIISFVLGYLIYRYVSLGIIYSLYNLDSIGKALVLYLIHVGVLLLIFKYIFHIRLSRLEKYFFLILYLLLMFMVFFDRPELMERKMEWNILNSLEGNRMIHILNILIFIPFYPLTKWIFPQCGLKQIVFFFILFALCIEGIQWSSMRGIWDVLDLILYTIGFLLGLSLKIYIP